MSGHASDLDRLLVAIAAIPTPWKEWPGGYPNRLDLALIDAVMSIRFRYGRERSDGTWTGARGTVLRYQKHVEHVAPVAKMSHLASQDPVALEKVLNRQKVHAGKTKVLAIVEAAKNFTSVGITEPEHLNPHNDSHRKLYTSVSGLGPVTWEYLTMLLNHDGVKADTWITAFVGRALLRQVSSKEAGLLVKEAADKLGVAKRTLDHAIWGYVSTTGLRDMSA
ncbi:hypothetical protein FDW83_11995 [Pseudarthrobacter sp. NamE2]|uniref:hypothetical protein n=1 Tax=Pseudarthrobacter sp. NamE2 TaxID=2576838 RepID=UPI0010FD514F|nr:hypothetical protein [Pseudarthrobacter sp. NamE2]TLM82669.1 hypothetical protein FDW83_11995 [Pseudarthrobacter sp. NamE2]